jgi:hypothetical protein
MTVTLEHLEALASAVESTENATRTKMLRMVASYARILGVKNPKRFKHRATIHADVDGHFDNSFPPAQSYKACTGPALISIRAYRTEDHATTGGYYHSWQRVTVDVGLYVDRSGRIYGANETGTGRVGQFAAYPGDCDVDCSISWAPRDLDELSTEELSEVEQKLRALAFPLVATASMSGPQRPAAQEQR